MFYMLIFHSLHSNYCSFIWYSNMNAVTENSVNRAEGVFLVVGLFLRFYLYLEKGERRETDPSVVSCAHPQLGQQAT